MRKVPNVNTHIFKQPRIPWLEGALTPVVDIVLPVFDAIGGALQHLWSNLTTFTVGDDGYTYINDESTSNTGTDRTLRPGSALEFNGIDGRFLVPYHDTLSFSNGTVDQPFSVTFLAYINDTSTTNYILSDTATSSVRNWLLWSSGSKLRASLYSAGGTSNTIGRTSANNLPSATWIYIVMTYDGSGANTGISLDWYEAGVSSSGGVTSSGSGSYTAMSGTTSSSLRSGLDATLYFGGRLADIRVHNTELTTAEIEALVDNPQSLTGHEVAIYHCDEEAGTTAFDSVSADNMTPEHESDFTSSIDGYGDIGFNTTFNETVGGETGALKGVLEAGTDHFWGKSLGFKAGRQYIMTAKAYVPSTNTKVDKVQFNNITTQVAVTSKLDEWEEITATYTQLTGGYIRIYALDGASRTVDAEGDVVYIKDIVITPVVEEGKHGTASGGVTHTTQNVVSFPNVVGWSEGGRIFNGTSDYIDTGVAFSPSGDYEISGWFNGADANLSAVIFDCRDGDNDGIVLQRAAGFIVFRHNSTDLAILGYIADSTWYNIVASKSGSSLFLGIYNDNGDLLASDTDTDATAIATTANAILGRTSYGAPIYWTGHLANIKAIDGSTTIIDMKDDSGFTYTGTTAFLTPASLTSDTPTLDVFGEALTYSGRAPKPGRLVNSHCATFDGIGDYIDTGVAFSPSGDFEISGWFKAEPTAVNSMIFDARDYTTPFSGVYIIQNSTTSYLRLVLNANILEITTAFDDSNWYRFVASRVGTTVTLTVYNIDGSVAGTNSKSMSEVLNSNDPAIIGANITGVIPFNGQLANIKAVDGSTTVFHYPFSEGAGLTAFDISGNGNHGQIVGTEAAIWANLQSVYHHNLLNGFDKWGYFNGSSSKMQVLENNYLASSTSGSVEVEFTYKGDVGIQYLLSSTTGVSSINFIGFRIQSGLLKIATGNNIIEGSTTLVKDTIYTAVFSSNGSSYSITLNGIDESLNVILGNNDGEWFSAFPTQRVNVNIGYFDGLVDASFIDGSVRKVKVYDNTTLVNSWDGATGVDSIGGLDMTVTDVTYPKLPASALPTGLSPSNPAGAYHNGAETEWQPNPYDDPELIYRAGLDSTDERASTDTFVRPEFINANDPTKVKDYIVYDKNISTAQGDEIDAILGN